MNIIFWGDIKMELPYCVFDISNNGDIIKLSIISIDEGTPESLERGGITADFNVRIAVDGITADIKCWLTLGNLYIFFTELQNCYNALEGSAILKYYSEDLTNISVDFNRIGRCVIHGNVKTSSYSNNGMMFGIECDQTDIKLNINKLKMLFEELAIIQGFYEFQY